MERGEIQKDKIGRHAVSPPQAMFGIVLEGRAICGAKSACDREKHGKSTRYRYRKCASCSRCPDRKEATDDDH